MFRLDGSPVSATHPELHPATNLTDSATERLSLWIADSLTDTVRVSLGDGFSGVTAVVIPSPTGLRGRAVGFSDIRPSQFPLGKVAYTKQPCVPDS